MKSIKDLREDYNLITEKEEHDMNKLTQLVRAGLFDAKKLSALKRAMDKPADKMTAQEKRMMINLLDSLMAEVLSDKQVYRKIKQDVMKEAKSWETKDYLSKNDPGFGRGFPDQKDMPSVLLLKRKGIRVFPDGQKIGLYYAQSIDRYVSIPFQDINLSGHTVHEETQLNELGFRDIVGGIADFLGGGNDEESKKKEEPKYLKPGEAGKTKLNVGGPKEKERDDDRPDAIRSRMNSMNRDYMDAQAKSARNVRESFMDKLKVLREDEIDSWENRVFGATGHQFTPYGGGSFGGGGRVKSLGSNSGNLAVKTKPSITPKRKNPSKSPDRRRPDAPSSPRGPGRYNPSLPQRKPTKPDTKPVEKPKPTKPDTKPVEKPKPTKPDTKPVEPKKPEPKKPEPTKPVEPKPTKPDAAPTHEPASRPREEPKPGSKPDAKPSPRGPRGPGLAALLPGLALGGVKGKPLTPGSTPGSAKLSLNVSGPKREGDPSAIASRTSSLEREMLKAQSKLRESVDLDGNLFELNSKEAKKVTALYESLNTKNKKKMVEAMNEGAESLEKVISFAVRQ
jgi:hypothetical protein